MDTESAFHVCLGPDQEQALEAALVDNGAALLDAFAGIDVRTAEAGRGGLSDGALLDKRRTMGNNGEQ